MKYQLFNKSLVILIYSILLITGLKLGWGEEIFPQSRNSVGQEEKPKSQETSTQETYKRMKEELSILDKNSQNGFDIEEHFKLALWCLEKKWKQTAVKELLEILKYASEDERVISYLDNLGYVNYEGQWITREAKQGLIERKVWQLLTQMKNNDEDKQKFAKVELEKISFSDKVNVLTHSLNDPNEDMRFYAVQELGEGNVNSVITPLVKVSLVDKSQKVREKAFITVAKIDKQACIHQYGTWAFNHDDASRIDAVDALKQLVKSDISNQAVIQSESATYYLISTMYRITAFIQVRKKELQGMAPRSFTINPPDTIPGQYTMDLPWIRSTGISSMTTIPTGMTIELEKQLDHVTKVLEDSTGQKLGNDYSKWMSWWNENIKSDKNKPK